MNISFQWTTGESAAFQQFYAITEAYYTSIVGGMGERLAFVPYNASAQIPHVVLALKDGRAVGCAGLKPYSQTDGEVKRLWVERELRGKHIATALMDRIEEKAAQLGFRRVILQTRPVMADAVAFYLNRGYKLIPNYPPYDRLEGAVCYAKVIDRSR